MAANNGIVNASFITFIVLFIISIFLGRLFCGWLCPGGGIEEVCFSINDSQVKRGNIIKYYIWFPWIATIVILL